MYDMNQIANLSQIVGRSRYERYGYRPTLSELLLEQRIIFLTGGIDDTVATNIVAHLLYMDREDREREIQLYINSPGGQVTAGLAIYDTMQIISAPITTVAVGVAASMGTILLTAGTKGRRHSLPNATIHLHQPLGGAQGQASDIEIMANEILRKRALLNRILRKHTGLSDEEITRITDRDFYMTAEEAKDYGIIDTVLRGPEDESKDEQE
jgi:ATP-dependent Clp protease protease subunit